MNSILLFLFIFITGDFVKMTEGCWPQEELPQEELPDITTERTREPVLDEVDKNFNVSWGGFTPSDSVKKKWKNWLADYKAERERLHQENDDKFKKERGPGSGWPDSWQGIGGGHPGDKPPPWAYEPINHGLPEFCYEAPVKGPCTELKTRWAFNAYLDDCVEFQYGCQGNQNNFDTKERCKQQCMIEPVMGCDPDTTIYIDN